MATDTLTDLETCPSWTGLTGSEDQEARQKGNRYYVFEYGPDNYEVTLDAVEAANRLNETVGYEEWVSWLCIYAESPMAAKERYSDARDQWEDSLS